MSKPTPEERIKAAQERRDAQASVEKAAHTEQFADDMEAIADLEAEHGYGRIRCIHLDGWKPGHGAATLVAARVPLKSESVFKRYESQITKPKADVVSALHTLAEACVVYPSRKDAKELYEATMDLAPGVMSMVGQKIVEAVQGRADEEKKD